MESYVALLRSRRPPWLHGFPSLLVLLAAYMLDRNIELGYQVRWITTGAENLLSQQADLIERAFGLRPKQHYGMAEAVANVSECECGSLHVDEDFSAVEFVPNPAGVGHRVIGTNFTNPATPLLRYDTQDIVKLSSAKCSCGRPGRVLEYIDGRAEDYLVLKNGARLGRTDHIFKDLVNVREAQIYQKNVGEMVVRVVRGSGYSQVDESMLLCEIGKRVGDQADIAIEYVEALERSESGKLRLVVSEIPEGQKEQLRL